MDDIPEKQEDSEDFETVEDLAADTEARVDALVGLLIKKGVISEQEFEKEYGDQFEDESGDEATDSPDSGSGSQ
jgi:hypothetical protein